MTDRIKDASTFNFLILQHEVIDSEVFDDAIEKMVYIVLKRHASIAGDNSFPSALTISKKVGCSTKTVYRKIETLVSKGMISKQSRFKEDGSKSSNLYTILPWDTESYGVRTQSPMGTDTESHKQDTFNDNHLEDVVDDANADLQKKIQKMQGAGLFFMNNQTNISKIAGIYSKLNKELFAHLVKISIEKKPGRFSYVEGIVRNWEEKNIDTVEKAIAESETRKKPAKPSQDDDLDKLRQMYGG